jgi:protein O-GlcNAc transferase
VFSDLGKLREAADCFRRALSLKPDFAEAHANLGNVLRDEGMFDEAVACYRRALDLAPDSSLIYSNLATAMRLQERIGDAITLQLHAVRLNPQGSDLHSDLGGLLLNQGKVIEAIRCYRKALDLKPDNVRAASNLLIALQYREGITAAELLAAHAEFERQFTAPLKCEQRPHEADGNPHRPIVVGFVSPNFRQHAVGHFVLSALERFDREQFHIVCYSDGSGEDDWTPRFKAATHLWHETAKLSDIELADQIRADRIDILFDLAGHTAKNRLLVFARRPAPIQITWADYVGTTGLTAMDYILADRYQIPPEAEAHYTERVLRMPNAYICYDPPPYAPLVSPLPALARGHPTFGSFNFRPKLSPAILTVWAKILQRVPHSRLVLKYRNLHDASVKGGIFDVFTQHGVDPGRIECLGWSPHRELLAEYQRIDIALDPFPYNGGLTTCEALWMGVPVVTCPGETFASRHSLSHLSNIGMTETVACDLESYINLTVSLASDLPRLAVLRTGLRNRVAASPLCDGKLFARELMLMLREIAQRRGELKSA